MRLSLAPAVLTIPFATFAPASSQCVAAPTPPGGLDTCFGTGGKVVTDFAGSNLSDMGQAVVIQPGDGKIVVGGTAVANGGYNVALARRMP